MRCVLLSVLHLHRMALECWYYERGGETGPSTAILSMLAGTVSQECLASPSQTWRGQVLMLGAFACKICVLQVSCGPCPKRSHWGVVDTNRATGPIDKMHLVFHFKENGEQVLDFSLVGNLINGL